MCYHNILYISGDHVISLLFFWGSLRKCARVAEDLNTEDRNLLSSMLLLKLAVYKEMVFHTKWVISKIDNNNPISGKTIQQSPDLPCFHWSKLKEHILSWRFGQRLIPSLEKAIHSFSKSTLALERDALILILVTDQLHTGWESGWTGSEFLCLFLLFYLFFFSHNEIMEQPCSPILVFPYILLLLLYCVCKQIIFQICQRYTDEADFVIVK